MPPTGSMPVLLISAIVLCLAAGVIAAWLLRLRRQATSTPFLESKLAQAREAHRQGQLDQAERSYRRVVTRIDKVRTPEAALLSIKNRALVELGNLARDKGDVADAAQLYGRAFSIGTIPDPALGFLAVELARGGDTSAKAAKVYGQFLSSTKGERLPDDEVIAFLTTHCEAFARSDHENELRELEALLVELLEGDPDLVWINRCLGTVLTNTGRPGEAIVAWRKAALLDAHDSELVRTLGLLEFQQGEFADAFADLEQSLLLHPDQPDLHNVLAQILLSHGSSMGLSQPDAVLRAADHLRQAYAAGVLDGAGWARLGEAQGSMGALTEAEEAFRLAFESDPGNDTYSTQLLQLLQKSNKIDQAKAVAEQAIAEAPTSLGARIYLAERALASGGLGEAKTHFKIALERDPNNQEAHRGLGVTLSRMSERQGALTHLVRVDAHTQESLLALARVHRQTRNPQLAIEILKSAPPEMTVGWEVPYELGCAAAQLEDWELATEWLRSAAGRLQTDNPMAGQAHFRLGIALSRSLHDEEALQAYEHALLFLPGLPDLHYALGHHVYMRADLDSAQASFTRTLELDPDHLAARLALGQIYERQGDLAAAAEAYRTVLEAHPDSCHAQVRLAATLAKSREWDQTLALLEPLTPDEQGFEARFWLSAARAHVGRYDESVSSWEALLEEEPSDEAIRSNLSAVLIQVGQSRFESGRFEEALEAWRRAGELEPGQDTTDRIMEASICLVGGLLQKGDVEGAASGIGSLPPAALEDSRVRRYRGLMVLSRNATTAAIEELASIADLEPGCGLYQHDAAVAFLMAGDGARCSSYLKRVPADIVEALPGFELVRATAAALNERWLEAMSGLRPSLTNYAQGKPGPMAHYCEMHAQRLVRQLLYFAQQANRLDELSSLCTELIGHPDTNLLGRAGLAMSMAARGDGDSALVEVETMLRDCPDEKEAEELALEILTKQATEELRRGGYAQALTILERAAEISPEDASLAEAISSLGSLQAMEAYHSGDVHKAISLWEQRLDQEPGNLRVLHQLAIATYRLASPPAASDDRTASDSDSQASERGERADDWWLRAIAYWVTLLFSDAFWQSWRGTRPAAAVADVDDNALSDIKQAMLERLESDIKDHAAATRGKVQPGEPLRLGAVEAAWGIEVQVAELMQQWAARSTGAEWLGGLSCGPLMLARLGRVPVLADQVARLRAQLAAAKDPKGQRLNNLLGSLGQCQYLLERGFFDQAVELLAPFSGQAQVKPLLVEAFLGKAREAAERKEWNTAWESFKRAAEYGGDLSSVSDTVAETCVAVCEQLQASGEPDAVLRASIDHLEKARKLIGARPEIRSNLGLYYGRRSLLANNANNYKQAVTLIKKALDCDPDEPLLRNWARVAHSNLAFETSSKDPRSAIQLLWKALSFEDTPEARWDISSALFQAEAWEAVIPFYRRWLVDDPSNDVWRHNLQAALHNLGLAYANAGLWDQAIEHLEEALRIDADAGTRELLARCYAQRAVRHSEYGNYYLAKRDLGLALKYDPNNYELRRIYYSI